MGVSESVDAFNKAVKDFNDNNKGKNYVKASNDFTEGVHQLVKGYDAICNGNATEGSAAVLDGIGSLVSTMELLGPAGALAGGILNALLGLISSILGAFKPPSESLISKIDKLIMEETLRNTHNEIKAGLDSWKIAEIRIDSWLRDDIAISLDRLSETIPSLYDHYERVLRGFYALDSHKRVHSSEWLPLYDLCVIYALRFWTYFESLSLVVYQKRIELATLTTGDMEEVAEAHKSINTFFEIRKQVARAIANVLIDSRYASVVEVDFNAVSFTSRLTAYSASYGSVRHQANPVCYRVGMMQGKDMKSDSSELVRSFAVSPGGTFFCTGQSEGEIYYYRHGTKWGVLNDGGLEGYINQIHLLDLGNDRLFVILVHHKGTKISFKEFDDRSGTRHESEYNGWTAGNWRWAASAWSVHKVPDKLCILAAAVKPVRKDYWMMHVFAVDGGGNAMLYDVQFPRTGSIQLNNIRGVFIDKATLYSSTNGVGPGVGRDELSPCTLTFQKENDVFLQVGNQAWLMIDGKLHLWNLNSILEDSDVIVYQARFYDDESIVFSTSKGLYLRFNHPLTGWQTYRDDTIKTIWFSKAVSGQARIVKALIRKLMTAGDPTAVSHKKAEAELV